MKLKLLKIETNYIVLKIDSWSLILIKMNCELRSLSKNEYVCVYNETTVVVIVF